MVGTFLSVIVGAFAVATLLTLIAQHVFDGRAGFEPTFRVVAYALAPAVLFWVPRLAVLAWIYSWYLQVRGIERVHAFDAPRAVLTVAVGAATLVITAAGLAGGWGALH